MTKTLTIYAGPVEALQAEIALLPCYPGPFVVAAHEGDGTEWTPESGLAGWDDVAAMVAEFRAAAEAQGFAVRVCEY